MKKKYGGNKYIYGGLGSLIIILIVVVILMSFRISKGPNKENTRKILKENIDMCNSILSSNRLSNKDLKNIIRELMDKDDREYYESSRNRRRSI